MSEHAHTQKNTQKREELQSVNFACADTDSAFKKERKKERNRVRWKRSASTCPKKKHTQKSTLNAEISTHPVKKDPEL